MSLFKPKDRDYIARGLTLLIVWFIISPIPFSLLGGWIAFSIGGTGVWTLSGMTVFLLGSIAVGVWLYGKYLDYGLTVNRREGLPEYMIPTN